MGGAVDQAFESSREAPDTRLVWEQQILGKQWHMSSAGYSFFSFYDIYQPPFRPRVEVRKAFWVAEDLLFLLRAKAEDLFRQAAKKAKQVRSAASAKAVAATKQGLVEAKQLLKQAERMAGL